MKKILIISTLTILLVGAVLSGCVGNKNRDHPAETPNASGTSVASEKEKIEGTLKLSGAFALYPMAVMWADEYTKLNPKVRIDMSPQAAQVKV
jgi:phosphate transport system substrate-binding protein